jgi:serine/threonine protein kinase
MLGALWGSVSPSSAAELPERIGRYRVLSLLGEGGMGVVYAALDESLGRRIAVKTIREPDPSAQKRFRREARAAATVNHPHVCQLFEIGEDQGGLFLAMELLTGRTLTERLAEGPLPPAEVAVIGRDMLSALSALHAEGIVHRDLKPSNVFLTPHGVKVLDFGLARPIPNELTRTIENGTELTQQGLLVGTPRYMAPEQVLGRRRRAHGHLRRGSRPLRGPRGTPRLRRDDRGRGALGDAPREPARAQRLCRRRVDGPRHPPCAG